MRTLLIATLAIAGMAVASLHLAAQESGMGIRFSGMYWSWTRRLRA